MQRINSTALRFLKRLRIEERISLYLTGVATLCLVLLQDLRGYTFTQAAADMLEYFSFGNSLFSFFFLALWILFGWKLFTVGNKLAVSAYVDHQTVTRSHRRQALQEITEPLRLLWPLTLFSLPLFALLSTMSRNLQGQIKDPWLNQLDNLIFGYSPFLHFPTLYQTPIFEQVISVSYVYLTHVIALTLVLCLLFKKTIFIRLFTLSFLLSLILGFPMYAAVPCQDPNNYFIQQQNSDVLSDDMQEQLAAYAPSEMVSRMTTRIRDLEQFGDDGAPPVSCFPSDHAVWAILTLYILYLLTPWSLILSIPWVFCVLSGGVYFGQHYVVDYIAGILVAIICIVGSNQLILRKNENQKSTT
ncbi:MAG: hypothetical protein QG626_89 [Patescibacteria group bacterium]|jgi:membrane-associated phospholipid phosphatase|nr:hypothetical protein [Patescibacteria group bacterium]